MGLKDMPVGLEDTFVHGETEAWRRQGTRVWSPSLGTGCEPEATWTPGAETLTCFCHLIPSAGSPRHGGCCRARASKRGGGPAGRVFQRLVAESAVRPAAAPAWNWGAAQNWGGAAQNWGGLPRTWGTARDWGDCLGLGAGGERWSLK